jgi:hypothetical protein
MSETIDLEFKSLQISVTYYEQPEEAATYDYPGCAGSFEIEDIDCLGVDLTQFFEQLELLDELEQSIYNQLK